MRWRVRVIRLTGVVVVAGLCLTAPGAFAQEPPPAQLVEIPTDATRLEGIPTVRIDAAEGRTTRRVLGRPEASADRLMVTVKDGEFYWASRGNDRLRLFASGDFTYLWSEPGKYIRLTRLNDRISYVEHLDTASGSITWWGELRVVIGQ